MTKIILILISIFLVYQGYRYTRDVLLYQFSDNYRASIWKHFNKDGMRVFYTHHQVIMSPIAIVLLSLATAFFLEGMRR